MKNKIFCGIASSLEITLPSIDNLDYAVIEPNQNINPESYSILVLDKQIYHLYSGKKYLSEDNFDAIAYFDKELHRPEDIVEICKVIDYLLCHPGMLSYQQIKTMMKLGMLIYEGNENRVEGASYDLLIDKEYLKSGIEVVKADSYEIESLDYVVVGAVESANLPKNIAASFDVQVRMFCNGIILSNGPQVDPGYQGRLLCLLFNTSAKKYEITPNLEFKFATIQFSTLSGSTDRPYRGKYFRKPNIRDYIGTFADKSISGIVKSIPEIRNTIKEIKQELEELKKRRFTMPQIFTAIIVAVIGGLVVGYFLAYKDFSYKLGKITEKVETQMNSIDKLEGRFEKLEIKVEDIGDELDVKVKLSPDKQSLPTP